MSENPFASLPAGPFDVIYADPPWAFRVGKGTYDSRRGKSAADHYPVLTMSELAALDVASIAAEPSALCMWVVQSELPDCIDIGRAWGFAYSTLGWVWHKQRQNLGYYTHPSVELCLIFRRGPIRSLERGSHTERQFVSEPTVAHSTKPHAVRESIERLWPSARLIELFARSRHDGWTSWGNELDAEEDYE